jgi:hypothetical protein
VESTATVPSSQDGSSERGCEEDTGQTTAFWAAGSDTTASLWDVPRMVDRSRVVKDLVDVAEKLDARRSAL